MADASKAIISNGIQFIAPDTTCLDIPFQVKDKSLKGATGFVSKRMDFDNSLFNLIDTSFTQIITNTSVEAIEYTAGGLIVTVMQENVAKTIFTKMIVGAEGRGSIVAKKLAKPN